MPRESDIDVGGEVAYNITPSLRAVGTINTDFAETEVDTAPRQPDALPAVLSGEARLLPRWRDLLRLPRAGVLLAPDRPRRQRAAAAHRRRRQADRPGRALRRRRRCTCAPAKTTARSAKTSWWCGSGAGCCSSPSSAASTPAARHRDRPIGAVAVRPPASTSASPRRRSAATRTSKAAGFLAARLHVQGLGDNAVVRRPRRDIPTTSGTASMAFMEVQKNYRSGGRVPAAQRLPPLPAQTSTGTRGRSAHPYIRRLRLRRRSRHLHRPDNRLETQDVRVHRRPARAAQRRQRRSERRRRASSASTSPSRSRRASRCRPAQYRFTRYSRRGQHGEPPRRRAAAARRVGHVLHGDRTESCSASDCGRAPA